jgi:four helix bundle protein
MDNLPDNSTNSSGKSFTELEAWKQARKLKIAIREIAATFPPEEKFRLTDQIIRSSRSVCANIAEGHGRYTFPDQVHFCIQARGSLSETYNHCIDAFDEKYLSAANLKQLKVSINECEKLLNGYINWLRKELAKVKTNRPSQSDN